MNQLEESIQSGEELMRWIALATNGNFQDKVANDGVMVSTKVRREVLTSIEQGRFVARGLSIKIQFENMQGGVWRAYCDFFYKKGDK